MNPQNPQPQSFPSRRMRRELAGQGTDGRMVAARQPAGAGSATGATPVADTTSGAAQSLNPGSSTGPTQSGPNPSTGSTQSGPERTRKGRSLSVTVMSGVGQTMLSVGVILALFVVWQVFVTTWQVQGATAVAVQSFTTDTASAVTQTTDVQRTDPPPTLTVPGTGQTFATLHVPRWDQMVVPIMEGTTSAVLDTGYAGHYTNAQGPGQVGNFALAAHRISYGSSFRRVEELQVGDPLVVETPQAWLVYEIFDTEIVLPTTIEVIYPIPHHPKEAVPVERLMTLTTCHPEYGNSQRFIVYSKMAYWVPKSSGRPLALQGQDAMKAAGQDVIGPLDVRQLPVGGTTREASGEAGRGSAGGSELAGDN